LALVTEADIVDRATLYEAVRQFVDECEDVTAGTYPVIVPKSVFSSLPLLGNFGLGLSNLAGEDLTETVENNAQAAQLRIFDFISFHPYKRLLSMVVPEPRLTTSELPLLPAIVQFIDPILSARLGQSLISPDVINLNKRLGLSRMINAQHSRDAFVDAFGARPTADSTVLDRVRDLRSDYFEMDASNEQYLSVLLDVVKYQRELVEEMLARQSIYVNEGGPFLLRHHVPALATDKWATASPYSVFGLFATAGVPGEVVPPAVAYHRASLPNPVDSSSVPHPLWRSRARRLRTWREDGEDHPPYHSIRAAERPFDGPVSDSARRISCSSSGGPWSLRGPLGATEQDGSEHMDTRAMTALERLFATMA